MESWQKEIEYVENLYFKGKLSCKYRGDINSYLTEKNDQGLEFINLDAFYAIEVNNVSQIQEAEYKKKRKLHLVEKYEGTIHLNYNGDDFDLRPNELFLIAPVKPEHEQTEEGQVHGTLIDQEVVFKLVRIKKRVVCKEGAIVSSELMENGDTREVYIADAETCEQRERIVKKKCVPGKLTGNIKEENGFRWVEYIVNEDCERSWRKVNRVCVQDEPTGRNKIEYGWYCEEFYNSDCTTSWKKIYKKCNPGRPTGNERINNGVKEIEYFKGDCSTIWKKETTDPSCIEGAWTGKERKREGWIQREYTRSNCSKYWENHRRPTSCFDGFLSLILLALVVLIIIAIAYNVGLGDLLLAIVILAAAYASFLGLIWLVVRFATFFQRLFRYIFYALSLLFVGWLLFSLVNGIKSWKPREAKKARHERIKEETQSEIIPPQTTEEDVIASDSVEIVLRWVSFDDKTYQGDYRISLADVSSSRSTLNGLSNAPIKDISEAYYAAHSFDQPKLQSLFDMLKRMRKEQNLNDLQFAQLIVSMVQSQDYTLVIPESCSDLALSGSREIRRLIEAGYPCESPHPFGIKTPLEFLTTLKGDCDTRTVTLYSVLKYFDFDVVILNSDVYMHSMLGINIQGVRGNFKVYNGKKYLFWETTSPNNPIGFLPSEFGIINNWYIALK